MATRSPKIAGSSDQKNIKDLTRQEVRNRLSELGQPSYRAEQLLRWLYREGATSYDDMTNLPAALRDQLEGRWPLHVPELIERRVSKEDETRKYLWRLVDGQTVESVGLPGKGRLTVCFSTQVGCAMGCAFCATGKQGFARDLSVGEMVDQVRLVGDDFGSRVSNAVAMGQGEPFANYDGVVEAMRIMNSPDGLAIGARHLSVSTCGLVGGIRRLSMEPEQFTLAVSLHSAVQKTRDMLMPGVKGVPLETLKQALIEYATASGRRPSLEYALIDGVNDNASELAALKDFCAGMLIHVNLIPINPVEGTGYTRSPRESATQFAKELAEVGVEVSVRAERGTDIDAACGQLKGATELR